MHNKLEATFRLARRGLNKDKPVLNIVEDLLAVYIEGNLLLLISVIKNIFLPQQKQAIKCI